MRRSAGGLRDLSAGRRRGARITAIVLLALMLIGLAVLGFGGYFDGEPYTMHWPSRRAGRPPLVAVYWSGDMGMRIGTGARIIETLRARGIPVLGVSSPVLFGRGRDRAFVDAAVEDSLETALVRSGAQRVAVVGSSFGADIVGIGLGRVAPQLRARIASVVLVVPETDIYFHANPSGIFYRGPVGANPAHTIPLLHGLPVTCIFGTGEDDSLCRHPAMQGARRIAIDDGHAMMFSHRIVAADVEAAVLHPPLPMR